MKKIIKYKILFSIICSLSIPQMYEAQEENLIIEGSTVISIARNDTIWIGADGMTHDTEGKVGYNSCKILTTEKLIFAHTGLRQYRTDKINIDVEETFNKCAYKYADPIEIIKHLNDSLIIALDKIGYDQLARKKYALNDTIEHPINAIFALNRSNIPHLYTVKYRSVVIDTMIYSKKPFHISNEQNMMVANDTVTNFILDGRIDAILENMIKLKSKLDEMDIQKLINKMIQIEAEAQPKYVGGETSIIIICPDGISWIQKREPCK